MGEGLQQVRRRPELTPYNLWRRQTPGAAGWARSARPGDPAKYFMFSADCHAVEPATYLDAIEPEYRDRTPRLETRDDGSQWLITEGNRPQRVKGATSRAEASPTGAAKFMGAATSPLDEEDLLRNTSGRTVEGRLADHLADGVDAELMFPNRGLLCWATPDPVFGMPCADSGTAGRTASAANTCKAPRRASCPPP